MIRFACVAIVFVQAWLAVPPCATAGNGQFEVAELTVNIYSSKKRRPPPPVTGDGYPSPRVPTEFGAIVDKLLKKRCTPDQNIAARYADIFFFRNPVSLGISPAQEMQLTAALMSEDGAAALDLTASLRQDTDIQTRLLANFVALHVLGRSGQKLSGKQAEVLFTALENGYSSMGNPLKADYAYMRALAALEAGASAKALKNAEDALAAEPQFFNAHVVRVAILVDLAERASLQGDGNCRAAYGKLAQALYDVMEFAPCALQAAHLARYLRSQEYAPDEHVSLLMTEAALSAISQQKPAFLDKKEKLLRSANRQSQCGLWILDNVADLERNFSSISSNAGAIDDVLENK